MKVDKRVIAGILAGIVAIGWSASQLFHPLRRSQDTTIWLLNVGQGLAVLIKEPGGKRLLFDTGPDGKVVAELGKVLPVWDKRIDLVIFSHWHSDHIRGFTELSGRLAIGEVWHSDAGYHGPVYQAVRSGLLERHIPEREVRAVYACAMEPVCPVPVQFGEATLQVLHPTQSFHGRDPAQAHDAGVVIKYASRDASIMLTGDLDESHERAIVAACQAPACSLRSGILQIPHHGSSSGLLAEFLRKVAPNTALIGVGAENTYHHPHPSIINRLQEAGIRTYRSDKDGIVQLVLNDQPYALVAPAAAPP